MKTSQRIQYLLSMLKKQERIIIYQMGKVGSTTLAHTLEGYNIPFNHPHTMAFNDYFVEGDFKKDKTAIYGLIRYIYLNYIMNKNEPIKIVTGVREPISRNISAFFQHLHLMDLEEDLEKQFYQKAIHNTPLIWFENELKKYFGIDVYSIPFDKESGFTIIENRNVKCFLYKLEKLNTLENELGDFLGIPNFKLSDSNNATDKWYEQKYQEFKRNFKPSQDYIDNLYDSRYMRHFYTKQEIEKYRDKWINKNENRDLG